MDGGISSKGLMISEQLIHSVTLFSDNRDLTSDFNNQTDIFSLIQFIHLSNPSPVSADNSIHSRL